jgi:chromatin remodeling complex protein RSC6
MPTKKVSKKTSKKTASKKATPVPTPKVVVAAAAPAATAAPVASATTAATPATKEVATPTLGDQFTALLAQLSAFRSQLTSVTAQVRALNKRSDRELKQALKAGRKKRKSGNRAPSGFVKPTKISMELANFLGKEKGTEMARTEVTREINTYIRAHKLQDPKNGRRILADAKLRKLLKLKKEDELTYFNLQRYMSPHFAKAGKKLPESA